MIYFYDDELNVIELAKNANEVLQFNIKIWWIKENVKEVWSSMTVLFVNQVTFNRVNRFLKQSCFTKFN
jgi:hypothetical protein